MVTLLKGLMIEAALPFARGLHLFILKLFPTKASLMNNLSISSCLLFSAFAIAALRTFKTFFDILLSENLSWFIAELTFLFTMLFKLFSVHNN